MLFIESSIFNDNAAPDDGGAIYAGSPLQIRNSAFWSNDAGGDGGALRALTYMDSPQILSSSFYQNTATGSGGGIALAVGNAGTTGIVRHAAMWANSSDIGGDTNASITYTCTEDDLGAGTGNQISATDPFELGPNNELYLDQASLCVDNGNDIAATTDYAAIGLDWQTLTTASDSTLDASPVDMGVHYAP
jgi:predicted outer membrane repeat protein